MLGLEDANMGFSCQVKYYMQAVYIYMVGRGQW